MRHNLTTLCTAALLLGTACSSLPIVGRAAPERWGFSAPWDPRSAASIRAHGAQLDAIVLDWIPLDTLTGQPLAPYSDSLSAQLPAKVRRMALLTSYLGDRFNPTTIRRLAADSVALIR